MGRPNPKTGSMLMGSRKSFVAASAKDLALNHLPFYLISKPPMQRLDCDKDPQGTRRHPRNDQLLQIRTEQILAGQ